MEGIARKKSAKALSLPESRLKILSPKGKPKSGK